VQYVTVEGLPLVSKVGLGTMRFGEKTFSPDLALRRLCPLLDQLRQVAFSHDVEIGRDQSSEAVMPTLVAGHGILGLTAEDLDIAASLCIGMVAGILTK
jgi:hypothetical protein